MAIVIDPYQEHADRLEVESLRQQLATVTSERDGIALLITSTKAELQEQLATVTAFLRRLEQEMRYAGCDCGALFAAADHAAPTPPTCVKETGKNYTGSGDMYRELREAAPTPPTNKYSDIVSDGGFDPRDMRPGKVEFIPDTDSELREAARAVCDAADGSWLCLAKHIERLKEALK